MDNSKDNILLKVQSLNVGFRNRVSLNEVVKGISFEVNKGETFAIVGESGSGKSVSLMALNRLLPRNARVNASQAELYIQDKKFSLLDIKENEHRKLRGKHIGMIFQEPMSSLNPVLTCGFQVAEVLRLHLGLNSNEARIETLELYNRVLLPNPEKVYHSYPHQLSGGQRQRVMIAMAIACKPSLLIADEPTTALDVTVQKQVLELLKSIQAEMGMSLVLISHDFGVVKKVANYVMVMKNGEVIEKGKVEDVLSSPQHLYTKQLLYSIPPLDIKLKRLMVNQNSSKEIDTYNFDYQKNNKFLQIKNLNFQYTKKGNPILKNINLDIYAKEIIAIVGESGSGKSTLGNCIMNILNYYSGEILYENEPILTFSKSKLKKFRKDVQIIFQDPFGSLNPKIKIGNQITEVLWVHKKVNGGRKARISKAKVFLEKVGLNGNFFDRYPHELSGGQRQRVCIAKALAVEPKLLVCDEATSALDVTVQAEILNLLKSLREDFNLGLVFITHNMSVVRFLADRVLVLQKGEIKELKSVNQIFEDPESEYTKELLNSVL